MLFGEDTTIECINNERIACVSKIVHYTYKKSLTKWPLECFCKNKKKYSTQDIFYIFFNFVHYSQLQAVLNNKFHFHSVQVSNGKFGTFFSLQKHNGK